MEAPKPKIQEEILFTVQKELKSEQGNNFLLSIFYKQSNFHIQIEKKQKFFNDCFVKKLSFTEIQENQYYKFFSSPKEILTELKDRIESKNPTLIEKENNIVNLIIYIPISKFKQIQFDLAKENIQLNENSNLKEIIEKMAEQIEKLEKENNKIKEENNKIKEENNKKNIIGFISLLLLIFVSIFFNLNSISLNFYRRNNFHWINREVTILNHSKFLSDFPPDIMISKLNSEKYSLTEGNRNHFIEFSFIKRYFLKSIRIKVENYDCSLKTFSVVLIDQNKNINLGNFIKSKFQDNSDFQEFEINLECKGVKLNLIDNWANRGGNYILISKIDFLVSD